MLCDAHAQGEIKPSKECRVSGAGLMLPSNVTLLKETLEGRGNKKA